MYKLGKKNKSSKKRTPSAFENLSFFRGNKKNFSLREGGWGHLTGHSHAKNRSSRKKEINESKNE